MDSIKEPSDQLPPLGSASKRDQAYDKMRRLLILQQLPEGERLREAEWTARLDVNRSALREAFARLAAEGLIERGVKTGYFVPALTLTDVLDVTTVRIALEGAAIDIVCESGLNTPQHLRAMCEACDLLGSLVGQDYHLSVVEADRRFHEALIQATGNKRLAIAYGHAPLPILHPDILAGEQWSARVRRTYKEHELILKTILEGQADRAKEALHTHLTGYWQKQATKAKTLSTNRPA